MKILLVGEYSRLHNSLKEGLLQLGHEVVIIASGDGFKDYPRDISLDATFFKSRFGNVIRQVLFRLTKYDIASWEILMRFNKLKPRLSGFDIVQLINESPFLTSPSVEQKIISVLKQTNGKLFLLSCGDDHMSVSHALSNKPRYSVLTPYIKDSSLKPYYGSSLKYISPKYKALHDFIYERIEGVIASDLDYHFPLLGHKKYLGLIANPVNVDTLEFKHLKISSKINIFLGVNNSNQIRKGVPLFRSVLERLRKAHPELVNIIITEDLPYKDYIQRYDEAHIILDQVYSLDQGYNALEAMAKGKVVFTGLDKEFKAYYQLDDSIAINASPNEDLLYSELERLVLNPGKIRTIGENARKFIEDRHHYKKIAKKYIALYSSSSTSESSV